MTFVACGLVRIPERDRPAVRSLLQESVEGNRSVGIKQTIYRPQVVQRFGGEVTASTIYCSETIDGLRGFAETELRKAQHIGNLQVLIIKAHCFEQRRL